MHFSSIEFSVESEKTDSVHIFNTSGFFHIFLTYYKLLTLEGEGDAICFGGFSNFVFQWKK